ncbi:hypothetical protein WMF01_23460 [Sorangium sp. So ce1667]
MKPLLKKAKHGFRGHPIATIIYYGPDDTRATKVAVSILRGPGEEPSALERWYATGQDARQDARIGAEIAAMVARHQVRTVAMLDRIYGCPHEEGTDYEEGTACPMCPFWAGRDRATGKRLH